MNSDIRRFAATIRDERALTTSLERLRLARFDLDTAADAVEKASNLLETLSLIASDHDFWQRLSESLPPTYEQLDRIGRFDLGPVGILLEAAGYRTPPPPPVDHLVDDAAAALTNAMSLADPPGAEEIARAQEGLSVLVYRARRQVLSASDFQVDRADEVGGTFRSGARLLAGTARKLLPGAAAAAAGGGVAIATGGLLSPAAVVAGKAAAAVASAGTEQLAEWALARAGLLIAGTDLADSAHQGQVRRFDDELGDPVTLISTHVYGVGRELDAVLRAVEQGEVDGAMSSARSALRHARRLVDLGRDHLAPNETRQLFIELVDAAKQLTMEAERAAYVADRWCLEDSASRLHRLIGDLSDRRDWYTADRHAFAPSVRAPRHTNQWE